MLEVPHLVLVRVVRAVPVGLRLQIGDREDRMDIGVLAGPRKTVVMEGRVEVRLRDVLGLLVQPRIDVVDP